MNMNVIDLFSGCGGFSYGFQDAGFHIIAGVDNEQSALNTFKLNLYVLIQNTYPKLLFLWFLFFRDIHK